MMNIEAFEREKMKTSTCVHVEEIEQNLEQTSSVGKITNQHLIKLHEKNSRNVFDLVLGELLEKNMSNRFIDDNEQPSTTVYLLNEF